MRVVVEEIRKGFEKDIIFEVIFQLINYVNN